MSTVERETHTNGYVGQSIRRKEDPRLIRGEATYVDDVVLVGMKYASIVRSTEAHANIVSVDASAALARNDVTAVFTGEDLADDLLAPMAMIWAPPGVEVKAPEHWPLAKGKVGYVGQAVAVVIGADRYSVTDAAEEVIVEYEPLPVVVDVEAALADETVVHEDIGTNKCYEWSLPGGDVDAGFAEADVVVERRIVNHRTSGAPIEPRGVVAEWRTDSLTMWTSTQVPHVVRLIMSMLTGIAEDKLRIITPEVGGGFGAKLQVYGEEILLAVVAKKLGGSVKWVETRSEHLTTSHHGRDQVDYMKIGAKRDGTITAIHSKIIQDLGAYHLLLTPFIPCFGAFVMSGCYKVPNVRTDIVGVFTNKMSTDAIRGAGRPEATHQVELIMDQLAQELGMDRLELRRKNFIPKEDFPADIPIGVTYDSGDYHGSLDKLLEHVDLEAFERERAEMLEQGIYRGIGFSTYVEICGLAPSRAVGPSAIGLQSGFWESATVRVHPTGTATLYTGSSPHGQGHETGFAQIVADRIGISPDQVDVIHGDTGTGPMGMGTYGSRSLSVGGVSASQAADKVAEKARRIVAHQLEAAPEDIELADGKFQVKGSPDKAMTLAEVSGAAYIPENLPEGMEPGLEEQNFYDPENFVWPFGAHACVVDIDADTGKAEVVRYVAVDDCGPAINPMMIEGQVHGGIAHSIGQALYEQVVYDEDGQLVTGNFVTYALPTANEIPEFETDRTETPSPSNPLGVKGVGEAGTIAATPAIVNAAIDALRPIGVSFMDMPLTPMRIWQYMEEARNNGAAPRASEQGRVLDEQAKGSAGSGPTRPDAGGAA